MKALGNEDDDKFKKDKDIDLVTFETILNYIKEIKDAQTVARTYEFYFQQHISLFYHFMEVPYRIVKKLFKLFDLEVKYMPYSSPEKYYFSSDERRWSLDFLIYCLMNHSNIIFDLSYFKEQEDKKEIIKFIRNKIYGAFLDSAEKHKLFDELDLKYESEYKKMNRKIKKKGKNYVLLDKKEYILPINHFEPVVFYHKYGLEEIPYHVKELISGKDIIDAGAFIGDSALVLSELNPRRIYAFEPLEENVLLLRKTIELNNLRNVTVIKEALASKEGISYIVPAGSGSFISKQGRKIELTTIDTFARKNSLNVGLIKMDVEGYEPEIIRGAE